MYWTLMSLNSTQNLSLKLLSTHFVHSLNYCHTLYITGIIVTHPYIAWLVHRSTCVSLVLLVINCMEPGQRLLVLFSSFWKYRNVDRFTVPNKLQAACKSINISLLSECSDIEMYCYLFIFIKNSIYCCRAYTVAWALPIINGL